MIYCVKGIKFVPSVEVLSCLRLTFLYSPPIWATATVAHFFFNFWCLRQQSTDDILRHFRMFTSSNAHALVRHVVMADTDSLGLHPFRGNLFDEFHLIADAQLIKGGTHHIVAMEVQFLAVVAPDETAAVIGKQSYHFADIFRLVKLGVAAHAPEIIFDLAARRIERITQGDVDVGMMIAIYYDLASRHADVNADVVGLTLMLVLVRQLHDHTAGNNMLKKCFQFRRLFANMRIEGVGLFHVAQRDL